MELLGLLFLLFIIIAQFVEGFALVNIMQFFRGKKRLWRQLMINIRHRNIRKSTRTLILPRFSGHQLHKRTGV